jgi:uncharacterized protein (TIGR02453 family)
MTDLRPILSFLADLGRHNEKAWFEANRPRYDAARATFGEFLGEVIDELRASDRLGDLEPKKCMARIYRDVRFSRDKSPYKTNFAAMIAPGGWNSGERGYYLSLAPNGNSMVAGGIYMPDATELGKFRDAIAEDSSKFKRIVRRKEFVAMFGEVNGERLKTAPKGYDREHPDINLLRLKHVVAAREFSDAEVVKRDFPKRVLAACRALRPFVNYLSSVVG